MMACQIIVPEPCQEDWSQMTPVEKGRHCDACCKTVVDFTGWSVRNIADFLRKKQSERVCGRFRSEQLNVPVSYTSEQWVETVVRAPFTFLQRVALIFLLAFGLLVSACNDDVTGEPLESEQAIGDTVLQAAPPQNHELTGIVLHEVVPEPDSGIKAQSVEKKAKKRVIEAVPEEPPQETMGVPVMEPEPERRDTVDGSR